eukprot:Clim_evm18s55 gene=Clim_evmTU18s55
MTDDIVGKTVNVGNNRYKVLKTIGEGGYSYVFAVQNAATGQNAALKRMLAADRNELENLKQEVRFLRQLDGQPNILRVFDTQLISAKETSHRNAEVLLVTEFMDGGMLAEILNQMYMKQMQLEPGMIWHLMYATAQAVNAMHSQEPKIIHRDLKPENILVSTQGDIKLCDFGSATTTVMKPQNTKEAMLAEDTIQRVSTLQYRAPEMVDLHSNIPITHKADVWATGCIFYRFCFIKPPFGPEDKLRIMSGKVDYPSGTQAEMYVPLLREMLAPDSDSRISIRSVLSQLEQLRGQVGADSVNVRSELDRLIQMAGTKIELRSITSKASAAMGRMTPNMGGSSGASGDQGPRASGDYTADLTAGMSKMGNMFKSAGMSAFSKAKKMVSEVSGVQMPEGVDITQILPKIYAMPFPSKRGITDLQSNSIEEVHHFLETNHPRGHYMIYNLTPEKYDYRRFNGQTVEFPGKPDVAPTLEQLLDICESFHTWLTSDPENVIAVHCTDGKRQTACVIAAYLIYCGMCKSPEEALQYFQTRRTPDGAPCASPSQRRYLGYFTDMCQQGFVPAKLPFVIDRIQFSPVPGLDTWGKAIKPYIEVFEKSGEKLVFSTKPDNADTLRRFEITDKMVDISMEADVAGDVLIVVNHAAGAMMQRLKAGNNIQLQLHTAHLDGKRIDFGKGELDFACADKRFSDRFKLRVSYRADGEPASNEGRLLEERAPDAWKTSCYVVPQGGSGAVPRASPNRRPPQRPQKDQTPVPPPRKEETAKPANGSAPKNVWEMLDGGSGNVTPAATPAADASQSGDHGDLLNLNSTSTHAPAETPTTKTGGGGLDDIFGASGPSTGPSAADQITNDFLGIDETTSKGNDGPDLLGSFDASNIMSGTSSSASIPRTGSGQNMNQFDQRGPTMGGGPTGFAAHGGAAGFQARGRPQVPGAMGNGGMGMGAPRPMAPQGYNRAASSSPMGNRPGSAGQPMMGAGGKQGMGAADDIFANLMGGSGSNAPANSGASSPKAANANVRGGASPKMQHAPPPSRPNYNVHVSHAEMRGNQQQPSRGASVKKQGHNPNDFFMSKEPLSGSQGDGSFSDLLSAHNFVPKTEDPSMKSMNAIRMAQLEADDPEAALQAKEKEKVRSWYSGKENNIRALLGSMSQVLWEGASWTDPNIGNMQSAGQIKKAYMKACLVVHPDKNQGGEHEELANRIFAVISEAYAAYRDAPN